MAIQEMAVVGALCWQVGSSGHGLALVFFTDKVYLRVCFQMRSFFVHRNFYFPNRIYIFVNSLVLTFEVEFTKYKIKNGGPRPQYFEDFVWTSH